MAARSPRRPQDEFMYVPRERGSGGGVAEPNGRKSGQLGGAASALNVMKAAAVRVSSGPWGPCARLGRPASSKPGPGRHWRAAAARPGAAQVGSPAAQPRLRVACAHGAMPSRRTDVSPRCLPSRRPAGSMPRQHANAAPPPNRFANSHYFRSPVRVCECATVCLCVCAGLSHEIIGGGVLPWRDDSLATTNQKTKRPETSNDERVAKLPFARSRSSRRGDTGEGRGGVKVQRRASESPARRHVVLRVVAFAFRHGPAAPLAACIRDGGHIAGPTENNPAAVRRGAATASTYGPSWR